MEEVADVCESVGLESEKKWVWLTFNPFQYFLGGHHLYKWPCPTIHLLGRLSILAKNEREKESLGLSLGVQA